ncbi:hypothetical protein E4U42_005950 [Claviceps africana]|uniref:Heterokaryon incompatibility domain-containing protein n=1 Tax=Claviceps africana TaxID=83212 RepID=A0A8K0NF86_9HYPO|nr:hypothetical protein E4U42_005950 [Claviceps africana]
MAPSDSSSAASIRYRPLSRTRNEIRLLEVQPPLTEDVNERLACRLVHERLDDDPEFAGLSTLYGAVGETECIQVNGAKVAVPVNVAEALRHVRALFLTRRHDQTQQQSPGPSPDPGSVSVSFSVPGSGAGSGLAEAMPVNKASHSRSDKIPGWLRSLLKNAKQKLVDPSGSNSRGNSPPPLRIWLDLLCINMRDAKEESERRSAMKRAYRHARMVIGWLGPADDTSALAIDIIRAWDSCMPANFGEPGDREAHPENYAPIMQWMAPVAHLSDIPEGITDPREVPSYKAISTFLNRAYFRNAWMLDDMALARFPAFLVADEIVSWKQILRLNRVNEDIKDHGAEMFPDNLRHLLEYMPLNSVCTFLKEFEKRQKDDNYVPAMLSNPDPGSGSPSMVDLPRPL